MAGSPAVTIRITGDGFRRLDAGVAREGSEVYADSRWPPVDFRVVPSRVIDAQHIEATVPASLLVAPRTLTLRVGNGVARDPVGIPVLLSNPASLHVVEPAQPVRIDVHVRGEQGVRSCFEFSFQVEDEQGRWVYRSGSFAFRLSSDDVDTPEPEDGGLVFFGDPGCRFQPLDGTRESGITNGWAYALAPDEPRSLVISVELDNPPVAGSAAVRVAGGWLSGSVLDEDGRAIEGVEVRLAPEGFDFGQITQPFWSRERGGWHDARMFTSSRSGFVESAVTGSDGAFRSAAVPPGSYLVYFEPRPDSGLAATWFDGASVISQASPVEIRDRADATEVRAVLGPGGTISGRVVAAESGDPLTDAAVRVEDPATGEVVARAETAADGAYRTTGLRQGTYRVSFEPVGGDRVPEWFPDAQSAADAALVTVADSEDTGEIGADLDRGAVLTGIVRAEDDPGPLRATVTVYDVASGTPRAVGYTHDYEAEGDGVFRTSPGLPPGEYRVRIEPFGSYPTFWWTDASRFTGATTMSLAAGEESTVEFVVPRGGRFRGVVTAPLDASGEASTGPASGVRVAVYDADSRAFVAAGRTNETGGYTTSEVPSGTYKVLFDTYRTEFAPEWHLDAPDFASAQTIALSVGETRHVDAHLDIGGSISGVVTDADGEPPGPVLLLAYRDGDRYAVDDAGNLREVATKPDGSFRFRGLRAGVYRISAPIFVRIDSADRGAVWYGDVGTRSTATPIVVSLGEHVHGADFSFGVPGYIWGTVVGLPPWQGTLVEFLDPADGTWANWGWVAWDGSYRSDALHAGTYVVRFRRVGDRAPEYHGGSHSRAGAVPVTVEAGQTVSGVDAELDRGSRISGTLRSATTGAPVPGVDVTVVHAETGEVVDEYLWSWWRGGYTTGTLGPGGYKLIFSTRDDVYGTEWFADADSFHTADVVTVAADVDTTGIDLSFEPR